MLGWREQFRRRLFFLPYQSLTKVATCSGKVRGDSELSKSKKELCSRVRHACLSLACLVLFRAHYFQTPAAQAKSLVARVYRRKILQIAIV